MVLAADETPESLRGIHRFIEQNKGTLAVDLVNVQSAVHRDVSTFVNETDIKDHHHEEGLKALAPARAALEAAGIPVTVHIGVERLPACRRALRALARLKCKTF